MSRRDSKTEKIVIWAVWIAAIILLWELFAFILDGVLHDQMAASKLPYFHNVVVGLVTYAGQLISAMLVTFSRALIGLAIGTAVGFLLAILMSLSKTIEDIAFPYLIVSQMIPVLGLAPIIFTLVRDMDASRIVIAAYITFFPVSVNMLSGLKAVDPLKKDLMHSYAARKYVTYKKLYLPFSAPYLFAGLKIAAPLSVTASILVDMLGSSSGIGVQLMYSLYGGLKDLFWAAVVMCALMGVISYYIVVLLEKLIIPWKSAKGEVA